MIGAALIGFGVDLLQPRRSAVPASRVEPNLRAAVVAGAVIGAIGGLIGLILGTLRVPALIRWAGEEPARVVGTARLPLTPAGCRRLRSCVRSG